MFDHFRKIVTYDVFLAPKMTRFGSVYDICDQIYAHKPDWNNFSTPQNDPIFCPTISVFSLKMSYFYVFDRFNNTLRQYEGATNFLTVTKQSVGNLKTKNLSGDLRFGSEGQIYVFNILLKILHSCFYH